MSTVILKSGSIFDSKTQALVCPVNCVGVMGAGLAKVFRDDKKFKDSNKIYIQACAKGEMSPGSVVVGINDLESVSGHRYVFYMATKFIYSEDSKIEYVEHGLFNLLKAMDYYKVNSVALPAIGAGLGKLPYSSVELMIKEIFSNDGKNYLVEAYKPLQ